MSGFNSPNLNPLDYQVWGNAGVLTQAATEAKTSSRVLKCTSVNLVCVTAENHDNAVKDYCKQLQTCVNQRLTF